MYICIYKSRLSKVFFILRDSFYFLSRYFGQLRILKCLLFLRWHSSNFLWVANQNCWDQFRIITHWCDFLHWRWMQVLTRRTARNNLKCLRNQHKRNFSYVKVISCSLQNKNGFGCRFAENSIKLLVINFLHLFKILPFNCCFYAMIWYLLPRDHARKHIQKHQHRDVLRKRCSENI